MTPEEWVARHPYLRPVADVQAAVAKAAEEIDVRRAELPDWDRYADDFRAGVPLLQSAKAAFDVEALQQTVRQLIRRLSATSAPASLAEECRTLDADLAAGAPPQSPGLLRFLSWAVLARSLDSVVAAFGQWRDEDRWLRNYCPMCGEPPAMAQLLGIEPGRLRLLCCGCCGSRWRYRRTACPFCDLQHEHRLTALAIDGEDGLRIDYCESCHGYLKTYAGQGDEHLLLADWTSLHLDLLAGDRGLKRVAASLYAL
jgi:FdhE protein